MKGKILFLLNFLAINLQAQFAPAAGQDGSTAIYKDSSIFVGWATNCIVSVGYQDILNPDSGYAAVGDSSMAIGLAGENGVVSLGDGGSAIVTFESSIINGNGFDFAVFENSFDDYFLELAFVEVSSDGVNYYRFPGTSNTQDTLQVGPFDLLDPTKINNLAGKYRALYGTPFDLEELDGTENLNLNNITHVKIVDVIGSINQEFASYDQNGNMINDPWPTQFPSSGFDLDAVGIINQSPTSISSVKSEITLEVYPNPTTDKLFIKNLNNTKNKSIDSIVLSDVFGKKMIVENKSLQKNEFSLIEFPKGVYFVTIKAGDSLIVKKIILN